MRFLSRASKKPSDPPNAPRDQLKAEYGELFDRISAVLFEEDPIGINYEENTDEYDPEVGTILPKLRHMESAEMVRAMVHGEFLTWFTPDIAGPESRYTRVAQKVWDIWTAHPLSKRA